MKTTSSKFIRIILCGLFIMSLTTYDASAENRKERKARQAKEVEQMMNNKTYQFIAERITPVGYPSKTLTSNYDLQVTPDTIKAYLPYIGNVYTAPMGSTSDMGIKFTSTNFDYKVNKTKNGWLVTVKINDSKPYSHTLTLSVTESGMSYLTVSEINRQSVSFTGTLKLE